MVTGVQGVLAELDVPKSRVHQELFFVEEAPPEPAHHEDPTVDGPVSEVTVLLDGRSTVVPVPRDTRILDGLQRVRPDLPFACKGGVCGTCRAKVLSGKVDMRRNFALEQSEVDAGFVVTCQSYPVSDTLTVDYDA
jgi:ring-1,2-phenylacetyl-CoA epoxidase subunit PaaE